MTDETIDRKIEDITTDIQIDCQSVLRQLDYVQREWGTHRQAEALASILEHLHCASIMAAKAMAHLEHLKEDKQ